MKIRDVRCVLSDDEKRVLSLEVVMHITSIAELKAQVKDHADAYAKKARTVQQGFEMRAIKCDDVKDFDRGEVRTVRRDTGEVVDVRAMTAEERQLEIANTGKVTDISNAPKKRVKAVHVEDAQ